MEPLIWTLVFLELLLVDGRHVPVDLTHESTTFVSGAACDAEVKRLVRFAATSRRDVRNGIGICQQGGRRLVVDARGAIGA